MADANVEALRLRFATIKHTVFVLSGKGGVGKSTVSTQIALALVQLGHRVGILDVDLCGPSLPRMFGVEDADIHTAADGSWVPVYRYDQKLAIMSIGFLLGSRDEAIVWRGPKKTAMIQNFLADVTWGDLDFLIIDTPPGTSDEHLTVVESLRKVQLDGAVLVTTPQGVALADVRREASFCKKARIPILGVVENMSGFVCPNCAECSNLFATGGGERLAEEIACPFLGRIPIDPQLGTAVGEGTNYLEAFAGSGTYDAVMQIVAPLHALAAGDAERAAGEEADGEAA